MDILTMCKVLAAAMMGLMVGVAGPASAGTILSVSGDNNGGFSIGGLNPPSLSQVVALSWSQTQAYSDVTINADPGGRRHGRHRQRLSGTRHRPQPLSNEVAHTTFTLPNRDRR